jgi:hypothetical protein
MSSLLGCRLMLHNETWGNFPKSERNADLLSIAYESIFQQNLEIPYRTEHAALIW